MTSTSIEMTPSRMAWWVAGGLALVGAGALAAVLITKAAPDVPEQTLPAKSAIVNKPVARTVAVAPVNANHGTVQSVEEDKQKGKGTGLGAVGGAVIGGVLGHQVGSGRGNDAATVVGAIGGGLAGHEVEKRARGTTVYHVQLRMDDGSHRTVTQSTAPAVGARFRVNGDDLTPL